MPDNKQKMEIQIISQFFYIPVADIEAVLQGKAPPSQTKLKPKPKPKPKPAPPIVTTTEAPSPTLDFAGFDDDYINATDQLGEIEVIKKFLPACTETKQTKQLYQLCPETEIKLREKILYQWVVLSNNFADIREVKPLTKSDSEAGKLAYQKYLKFF